MQEPKAGPALKPTNKCMSVISAPNLMPAYVCIAIAISEKKKKRTRSAPSSPSLAARISSIGSATWAALSGCGATPNPPASAARSDTCPSYDARKVDRCRRNPPPALPPKDACGVKEVAAAILKPAPRKVVVGDDGEVREEEKGEAAAAVPARTEAERIEEAEVLLRTEAEAAARLRAAVRRRREFIVLGLSPSYRR